MPVILNQHGVPLASTTANTGSPEHVDGRAVIGYHSIFRRTDSVITVDEDTDFPVENAFDDLTFDYFKTDPVDGEALLTVEFEEAVKCDYLAMAVHDLYSKGAVIDYLAWDPDTSQFVSVLPAEGYVPVSDSPFLISFDAVRSTRWQLKITATEAVTIANLFAGVSMPLQRFVRVGHVPAPVHEDLTFITNESEGGQFIGRSLVRKANLSELQLSWLTPKWTRENWRTFQVHARKLPFFFQWDSRDFPHDVIFGYADGVPMPSLMNPLYESVNLKMRGVA